MYLTLQGYNPDYATDSSHWRTQIPMVVTCERMHRLYSSRLCPAALSGDHMLRRYQIKLDFQGKQIGFQLSFSLKFSTNFSLDRHLFMHLCPWREWYQVAQAVNFVQGRLQNMTKF